MRFLPRAFAGAVLTLLLSANTRPLAAAAPVADAVRTVRVSTNEELRSALAAVQPGTRIELVPGTYAGGHYLRGVRGEAGKPVIIAGADRQRLPRITGGAVGLHISNAFFVELHDLEITGATGNGVSLDDGGQYAPAARGIVLRGLHISNIGPRGNSDAIKLSGLHGFRVENCVLENWGVGSGSGIDMVGCHDGLISGCTFRHQPEANATGGNGVQMKGGSSDIVVRRNRFEHAGTRAVNLGGSTGVPYFRPPLDQWPAGLPRSEARNLTVEGNTFIGSLSPLAFVGVDGATVRFNTIYRPSRWGLRMLRENNDPGLSPNRNVVISDNLFAFRSDEWSSGGVNIGAGGAPETFQFARNHWFCVDQPHHSGATLPTREEGGTCGTDPQFVDEAKFDLRLKPTSPVKGRGADALPGEVGGKGRQ